jgi:hypothetical protein
LSPESRLIRGYSRKRFIRERVQLQVHIPLWLSGIFFDVTPILTASEHENGIDYEIILTSS